MVDPNEQQQFILTEGSGLVPGTHLTINTNDDGPDAQITAEFVQADCPSPGNIKLFCPFFALPITYFL